MGNVTDCLWSPSEVESPERADGEMSVEERRRMQAEAAMKRQKEAENRGIKDPARVKRQEAKDRVVATAPARTDRESGLRWQVS